MFICPICSWPRIKEDPSDETYEICPSCGVEYGYEDTGPKPRSYYHKVLRQRWISKGCPWYSKCQSKPEWWNPIGN